MLGIDTRTRDGFDGVIVRLTGAADYEAMAQLERALSDVLASRPRHLIVDLAPLQFLNSGAIGRLVEVRKAVLARGGRVLVAGASKYVAECFRLSRLDHAFEMVATAEDAVAKVAGSAEG